MTLLGFLDRLGLAACFLLIAAGLVAQGPKPIPRHKPDGNTQHDNQPEFCQNHSRNGYAHNCDCREMEKAHCPPGGDEGGDGLEPEEPTGRESSKCKVYCRKDMCRCVTPCNG